MTDRLVTMRDLRELGVVISKTQIYRLIGAGLFPQPVRLSERRVAWERAAVVAWVEQKIAESKGRKRPL